MSGYPEWRHRWDHAGGWPPTVDDITTLLTEIDRLNADPMGWAKADDDDVDINPWPDNWHEQGLYSEQETDR